MSKSKQPFGARALKAVQKYFPQVEHIADATKPLIIEVTKLDNQSAEVKKHGKCALAVACKRKTNADGVAVGTRIAYVVYGKKASRFQLLETTSREIVSFDRNGGFDTGVYTFKVPHRRNRLDAYRAPGPKNKKTGRKGNNLRHYTRGIRTVLGSSVGAA